MKNKLFVLFIALFLMISLVACGGNDTIEEQTESAVLIESISISEAKSVIDVDSSVTVFSTILPHKATNRLLEWFSSNNQVLKASNSSSNGQCTFRAVSPGVARVYAKSTDGSNITSNEIEITVTPYYQISLNAETLGFVDGINTGNKTITVGGISYTISFQNVNYSRSTGTFSLGENTGSYATVNDNDDSFIAIGGMCHNTRYSGTKIRITTPSAPTTEDTHFKLHTYYYGNNGKVGNVVVGNYGGTIRTGFTYKAITLEKTLTNFYRIEALKICADEKGINLPISSIEIRVEEIS